MAVPTVAPTEIYESGDSALRVVAISGTSDDNWLTVHRLADWLEDCGAEGLRAAVPTYDSVLVEFDPVMVSAGQMRAFVRLGLGELARAAGSTAAPREFDVPVVYGGEFGPDLLGGTAVATGASTPVTIDAGAGGCLYDLRAELAGGQTLLRENINVCRIADYYQTR